MFHHYRWKTFQDQHPQPEDQEFSQQTPNFVVELRSESNTAQDIDKKMNKWITGGVEVSRLMMITILLLFINFANINSYSYLGGNIY